MGGLWAAFCLVSTDMSPLRYSSYELIRYTLMFIYHFHILSIYSSCISCVFCTLLQFITSVQHIEIRSMQSFLLLSARPLSSVTLPLPGSRLTAFLAFHSEFRPQIGRPTFNLANQTKQPPASSPPTRV